MVSLFDFGRVLKFGLCVDLRPGRWLPGSREVDSGESDGDCLQIRRAYSSFVVCLAVVQHAFALGRHFFFPCHQMSWRPFLEMYVFTE